MSRNRSRALLGSSLAAVLALSLSGRLAVAEVGAEADPAKPFIVKIHADWCGTCTRLEPTWEALDAKFGSKVRLVVLDVTDRESVARATAEADRLGIREFFDTYKSKTGTVGVLDGASRQPVSVMKGETDLAAYESAVAKARQGSPS